jgi:di/tricarboxylate transporter
MTISIILMLAFLLIAIVLFSFEQLPADIVAIGLLLGLILTGLLPSAKAFAGFGSGTFIMIFGLLVLTAALIQNGMVDILSRALLRNFNAQEGNFAWLVMVAGGALSTFMSNTGATAFFIPIIIGISRQLKKSPALFLMPLAFASILASSVTLIGTSTNIVIDGLIVAAGLPPLGMFELSIVGLPILFVGILYMGFIGNRMIPLRDYDEESAEDYDINSYLSEILVKPDSPLIGKTLLESELGSLYDLNVVRILRGKRGTLLPTQNVYIAENDVLLVEGRTTELLNLKETLQVDLKPMSEGAVDNLENESIGVMEVILLPRSPLVGRTLPGLNLRKNWGIVVLGINRSGHTFRHKLTDIRLATGDQLLIMGNPAELEVLDQNNTFRILRPVDFNKINTRRAFLTLGIFLSVIFVSLIPGISVPVAVMLGMFALFVTRCITPQEAYRSIDWRLLILIGSMLSIGVAMDHTGTATYLAGLIVEWTRQLDPIWLLSGFFMLTMLLTQPMSNQAAAIVVVPIALNTAVQLGLNPRTFAVMIAVGASCSFLTPLEPACLMVYGPGNYRFIDFIKIGFLLTLIVYAIAILIVPIVWPLTI